ncbi:hypothetical protein niasHT_029915 [Heterodera trifolii]|uniref:Uncharacterized protein n=1 Tax=Heterodera trifolii TaxID=157864 RepID=A0ABD2KB79_9BILA
MSLFRRRLAIFIVLLAFFPHFCGTLKCVQGLVGLKKYDVQFQEAECANPNYKRCHKIKCSAAPNKSFLHMDCYEDDTNCDHYIKTLNAYFKKMGEPANWECSCKFGGLLKDNPYPLPASVCKHAFTYDNTTYKAQQALVKLTEEWGITKDKPDLKCHGNAMVGCQTYRCVDGYDNDEFVINACASEKRNCSFNKLDKFCNSKKSRTKCDFCEDGDTVCNANNTELRFQKYIDCKLSMDYSSLYTPSAELKEWVTNRNIDKDLRTCAKRKYKCQTFTCTDKATGYPLFTFKDCAEPGEKCKTDELEKFCAPPLKWNCSICEGSKCNQRMPIPYEVKPLQYFAWANCAPAAASCKPEAAKFSRRFAIGQECEKVYNEKVWNLMGGDMGKSIYDEYGNSDKANDPLFLADFIRAFIEDEKKT